ncbi:class II aaRS and biotin synthetase [Nadsonia fulvescens var. elongata DSM 6958]|uniref:Lysine--tRNA ligase n=1 Tax=Nadsonia fulvescens var. elongata DSM 6958 TaxID=857566 RepID=A0A1E3PPF6_9ASCO|nr:class II aaRS and biotin synthetase [Nadsonia fulvescens var. elongata DSM 6958]
MRTIHRIFSRPARNWPIPYNALLRLRAYSSVANRQPNSTLSSDHEKADFANRKLKLLEIGKPLYPLMESVQSETDAPAMMVQDFIEKYSSLEYGEPCEDFLTVHGRVMTIRRASKGLIFLDVYQNFRKVQVVVRRQRTELTPANFEQDHSLLRRGDIILARGNPGRTKAGELSLLANQSIQLLAPSLHPLPENLTNVVKRSHNRVVDILMHDEARERIQLRWTVMSYIREFFNQRHFTEVHTPILSSSAGGASATPFSTVSEAEDKLRLSMRIAPELWLKRFIISGFDRVYEIGPCFRNEGIDATHNPEFTTCEFYQSFASLSDLMTITQELLVGLVTRVGERHPFFNKPISELQRQLIQPIKVLDFVSEIEAQSGAKLPVDLACQTSLVAFYKSLNLALPSPESPAKLLDHLAGIYIEPHCIEPTFVINHPAVLSPLAKSHISQASIDQDIPCRPLARRFELFIKGKEFANAYEEENSPEVQSTKFRDQLKDKMVFKDSEAPLPDDNYVRAMEWGMPPTGGWGLGIDRLCMLLTGATRIEQVLPFGSLRSVNKQ